MKVMHAGNDNGYGLTNERIVTGLSSTFTHNLATSFSACQPEFSVASPLKMGSAFVANGSGLTVPSPQLQLDSTANCMDQQEQML